jgi:hypothetical protein
MATAAQPSGDKSPRHKDAVHIPRMCLCEQWTPCGQQIYQSCRNSLWRGDSSPLGCEAAPKPATTVSTGPPHVSKWRLLRSRAGINPVATRMLFKSPGCVFASNGLPVARGFIPAGLRSGPKTCHHSFYRPTACEEIAPAAQPSGDKSPRHKDVVQIPMMCLCEQWIPCGQQIYQSCRNSLWRGDSSPLGCKAAPKPASTVSTGPPHVSELRLLRSRAGINPLATRMLFKSP